MNGFCERLRVMDQTALSLCMENNVPIIVFDIFKKGNLRELVIGKNVGTIISNTGDVKLEDE